MVYLLSMSPMLRVVSPQENLSMHLLSSHNIEQTDNSSSAAKYITPVYMSIRFYNFSNVQLQPLIIYI